MEATGFRNRGSALLMSLGVLALLAIMGTTFVALMRIDNKMNMHYVDDVQCELLARGLLEYCRGILSDDLDRSMKIINGSVSSPRIANRYENRDTSPPFIGGITGNMTVGMNTHDNIRNTNEKYADVHVKGTKSRYGIRLGIPPSNDFWITIGRDARNLVNVWSGAMVASWQHHGQTGTFYCRGNEVRRIVEPLTWGTVVYHYVTDANGNSIWDPSTGDWAKTIEYTTVTIDTAGAGYDIWVSMCENGINDNPWEDNTTDPYAGDPGVSAENSVSSNYYYDVTYNFITPGGPSTYLAGPKFTGDEGLPGGRYWRTAVRIGMPEAMWWNFNLVGNLEKDQSDHLNDLDDGTYGSGVALKGYMAKKPPTYVGVYSAGLDMSNYGDRHLGLLGFIGYNDELPRTGGNKPQVRYDAVCYSPLQVSLREILFDSLVQYYYPDDDYIDWFSDRSDDWAEEIIRARYGGKDRAAQGVARYGDSKYSDRFRPGWRADGATFYTPPSPDNPIGSDRYYGPEEALDHATPSYMIGQGSNAAGSRLYNLAYGIFQSEPEAESRTRMHTLLTRGFASTLSRDTILRGKIWHTEIHGNYRGCNPSIGAYEVPGNLRRAGEWRHISILKRVNLNILGATTGSYNSGDRSWHRAVKNRWRLKQRYEQDRCYYMLKGALLWSGNSEADAAKKACSLIASLTDMIDRDNTETKYVAPDGKATGYGIERFPVINEVGLEIQNGLVEHFRVELVNPSENIPWLHDSREAIDLTGYKLKIVCPSKTETRSLASLKQMITFDDDAGNCQVIPMDGYNLTYRGRYLHVNMDAAGKDFTPDQLAEGVQVELIKEVDGRDCLVDRAADWPSGVRSGLHLATYNDDNGGVYDPPGGAWVGIYRRIDPLNAKTRYSLEKNEARHDKTGADGGAQCSVIHAATHPRTGRKGLSGLATFGLMNQGYNEMYFDDISTTYNYHPAWCRDIKIPNTDLPSIGWIGEAILYSYFDPNNQGKTITELSGSAQVPFGPASTRPNRGNNETYYNVFKKFANQIDRKAKLNLFKPFGDARNLHILDIFTCWDPSNDGEDNDGDGNVDENDEVVVHGRIDINMAATETQDQIFGIRNTSSPYQQRRSSFEDGTMKMSTSYPRGLAGRTDADPDPKVGVNRQMAHPGPRETIGDLIRMGRLSPQPGFTMSGGNWAQLSGDWGDPNGDRWDSLDPDNRRGVYLTDDDLDGKFDEIDEGDMLFTWYANLLTTRNNVFTVEIIAELTEPPYQPGHAMPQHKAYKVAEQDVHARKHLLAVLDRTPAFQVQNDGTCDFAGPVKVLMLRWAQINK